MEGAILLLSDINDFPKNLIKAKKGSRRYWPTSKESAEKQRPSQNIHQLKIPHERKESTAAIEHISKHYVELSIKLVLSIAASVI